MNLTPAQTKALGIIREQLAREPNAEIAYGEGTEIRLSTARALASRGLVTLHAGRPHARPCRAGYGRAHNAFTVSDANRWLTLAGS